MNIEIQEIIARLRNAFFPDLSVFVTSEAKLRDEDFDYILRHIRAMRFEVIPTYLPFCLSRLLEMNDIYKIEDYINFLNVNQKTDFIYDSSYENHWGKGSIEEARKITQEIIADNQLRFKTFTKDQCEAVFAWLNYIMERNLVNEWVRHELLSAIDWWKNRADELGAVKSTLQV